MNQKCSVQGLVQISEILFPCPAYGAFSFVSVHSVSIALGKLLSKIENKISGLKKSSPLSLVTEVSGTNCRSLYFHDILKRHSSVQHYCICKLRLSAMSTISILGGDECILFLRHGHNSETADTSPDAP